MLSNPATATSFRLKPEATPSMLWLPNHPQRRRMTALRGRRSELRSPRLLSASGEGIELVGADLDDRRTIVREIFGSHVAIFTMMRRMSESPQEDRPGDRAS
jgi:hypothetical protein